MKLSDLKQGEKATVEAVEGKGAVRRRIIDMGITPGVEVKLIKTAPMGDPMEIKVRGYELSIRKADAENIIVSWRKEIVNE